MLEDFCPLSIRVAVPPRRYSDSGSETAVRNKQDDSELDARIRSYERPTRCSLRHPRPSISEAVDLSKESEATKKLYGMDEAATSVFGSNCRKRLGRPQG